MIINQDILQIGISIHLIVIEMINNNVTIHQIIIEDNINNKMTNFLHHQVLGLKTIK